MSWAATAFRVCAWRLCLAVMPVDGARPAGPDGSTPGDERAARGLRGLVAVPVGGGGAWPGFEIDHSERSSWRGLRAGGPPPTGATGRIKWAGLAPPGSAVAKMSRGSEVGRSSASGGVEVEEGD